MVGSNRAAVRHDRDMREKRSWPVRCRVTIRSSLGQTRRLYVLTWLGPEKAVAMAAHTDGNGFGTSDGIYDVEVEELGPAELAHRGLVLLEGHLSGRMEF